jgi:hypothetical protein
MYPKPSAPGEIISFLSQQACEPSTSNLGKLRRHGVAQLAHSLRPRAQGCERIRHSLEPGCFAHGEVSGASIVKNHHIFPSGNAVDAGLQGFGRDVEFTSCMPRILLAEPARLVSANAASS